MIKHKNMKIFSQPSSPSSSMNHPIPHVFDPANARELCALSAQAYQNPASAEPSVFWKEKADTHVLIHRHCLSSSGEGHGAGAADLIFAFRGTADLRNG